MASFKVAGASEYPAITGLGIDDVKVAKKAWVCVGQECIKFDTTPVNYEFEVQAMSSENFPLMVTAAFTIGPKVSDDKAQLILYAKLVAPHDEQSSPVVVRDLVKGVVEGETRVLASSMTMEEMLHLPGFLVEKVQVELNKFGLYIYNANVKHQQLVDVVPGQENFSNFLYLGQTTKSEEWMNKESEGTTLQKMRQEAQAVDVQTKSEPDEIKVFEDEREAVIAAAKAEFLATKKAAWEWDRHTKVGAEIEEYELQMEEEYERMNALPLTNEYETQEQDSNKHKAVEAKAAELTRMRSSWWSRLLKPLASCIGSFSAELVMEALEDELN